MYFVSLINYLYFLFTNHLCYVYEEIKISPRLFTYLSFFLVPLSTRELWRNGIVQQHQYRHMWDLSINTFVENNYQRSGCPVYIRWVTWFFVMLNFPAITHLLFRHKISINTTLNGLSVCIISFIPKEWNNYFS